MSEPQYKFIYFDARYLGDPIRWIFLVAGVPFEDYKFGEPEWPDIKPTVGVGQVPVLIENGREMTQSASIARYLAKKFKLTKSGTNELQEFICDECVDLITDLRIHFRPLYRETDPEKQVERRKELLKEIFPKFLGRFNKTVEENGGPFLIGKDYTWADFFLANFLDLFEDHFASPTLLNDYPALKNLKAAVFNIPAIKKNVAERPKNYP